MTDMDVQSAGTARAAERPMGRQDWIDAALVLLVLEGVEAVKVLRLAEDLGVTRGGFYWHFEDRADLLDALIRSWERKNTRAMATALQGAGDLTSGILALFDCWLDVERFDPKLDSAMRDWARRSERVRRAVKRADDRRVQAITELFGQSGYKQPEAFIRARILYFTQVGYYALDIQETMDERSHYLEAYYRGFTGMELDPEIGEAYLRKHSAGKIGPGRRPGRREVRDD